MGIRAINQLQGFEMGPKCRQRQCFSSPSTLISTLNHSLGCNLRSSKYHFWGPKNFFSLIWTPQPHYFLGNVFPHFCYHFLRAHSFSSLPLFSKAWRLQKKQCDKSKHGHVFFFIPFLLPPHLSPLLWTGKTLFYFLKWWSFALSLHQSSPPLHLLHRRCRCWAGDPMEGKNESKSNSNWKAKRSKENINGSLVGWPTRPRLAGWLTDWKKWGIKAGWNWFKFSREEMKESNENEAKTWKK